MNYFCAVFWYGTAITALSAFGSLWAAWNSQRSADAAQKTVQQSHDNEEIMNKRQRALQTYSLYSEYTKLLPSLQAVFNLKHQFLNSNTDNPGVPLSGNEIQTIREKYKRLEKPIKDEEHKHIRELDHFMHKFLILKQAGLLEEEFAVRLVEPPGAYSDAMKVVCAIQTDDTNSVHSEKKERFCKEFEKAVEELKKEKQQNIFK